MLPSSLLPPLALAEWEATKTTLHLYMQIVGKIQLKLNPKRNHWWHVAFYPVARGISSQQIPYDGKILEILFNLIDHRLEINTSAGEYEEIVLEDGLSVAAFYQQVFAKLQKLQLRVRIVARPFGLGIHEPFNHISQHHTYHKEPVERFWKILLWSHGIFQEFCSRFSGKTCPVQLYWHHLDLNLTRYSGRKAPSPPKNTGLVTREAFSHELISFGLLPGDDWINDTAFYAYHYPAPAGINQELLQPPAAQWVMSKGMPMALLMYNDLRLTADPEGALLAFMESAWQAGVKYTGWYTAID
jgi:hypothetical protein